MRKGAQEPGSGPLGEAARLFDAGDKIAAGQLARQVLDGSPTDEQTKQANELLDRLRLPKAALGYAALAAAVISLMILLALFRS
jgi:hypothetical protein